MNDRLQRMPVWLLGLAVILRGAVFALVIRFPSYCQQGDSSTYLTLAHQLWSTGTYTYPESISSPAVILPPGYPFLLAPFTALGPPGILLIALLQSLLGVLSVCLLWRWLLMMADFRGAIWGTALFAVDWTLLAHTPLVMADGVMVCLLIISFHRFWIALRSRREMDILKSGLLWGIVPMIKPVSLYLPLLLSLAWTRTRKSLALFLVAFSLVPLLWTSRNYSVSRHFIFSSMGGRHLLQYVASNIEALRMKRSLQSMMPELEHRVDAIHPRGYANEVEADQAYGEFGWTIVRAHPYLFLEQNAFGMIKLLAGTGVDMLFDLISEQRETTIRLGTDSPTITGRGTSALLRAHPGLIIFQILYWIYLAVLYGSFARGLWRGWKAGRRVETLVLIEAVCYFLALTSHVGYYRFRLLLMPLLAAGAAAGAALQNPDAQKVFHGLTPQS